MFGTLLGAALLGGLLGGLFKGVGNLISYGSQYKKYKEDAAAELKEIERQKEAALESAELSFNIEKDEANKSADKSDKQSTLNEGYTTDAFNNKLDQIQAQQEAEGLAFNAEAQNIGKSTGDALSSMAASGTRSSSMETAIDLEAAMNAMQLQAAEDQARAGDNIQLANLFTNVNQSVNAIQTARTDAVDLRNNYLEDGNAWSLYQNKLKNINEGATAQTNEINRQLKYSKDHKLAGYTSAFFGGFGSGWSFGSSVGASAYKWANP